MKATVEVFWNAKPDVPSERAFLKQLKADLSSAGISATILANYFTSSRSRQVDFLVITENHVSHVELKGYRGIVRGSVNGPWSVEESAGTMEVLDDRENPYTQTLGCKMAISDDMHNLAQQDSTIPQPSEGKRFYTQVDSVICIFPRLEDGSEVPDDYKVRTLGYADFVSFLTTPGKHPGWTRDHWSALIRMLGLTKAVESSRSAMLKSVAEHMVGSYTRWLTDFYARDLHELVPLPLKVGDAARSLAEFVDDLHKAKHVQLVGTSGSGKSHLVKHVILDLSGTPVVPILVEGIMYEGRLSTLLDRSVARFTTASAKDLLNAAAINGQTVLLVVDGYNECPEAIRERLLGDLSSFCRRTNAMTLITSQASIELPSALQGIIVVVSRLSEHDREAVLRSYGAPGILDLCEPFMTAYELSIAAECASELSGTVTRGSLFAEFIRKRLRGARSPALTCQTLRQLALVMDDRLTAWLPLDNVWRISEEHLTRQSASVSVLDDVLNCTITRSEQGRFSFTHEMLGRFLTTEALRQTYHDPSTLARQLRMPRHADLAQLALELETDAKRVNELLTGLADWLLYVRALRGEAGQTAQRVARQAARRLLHAVTSDLENTTFTIHDQFQMTVTGGYELSQADRALLEAVAALLVEGVFVEEVASLLDATDAACQRSADAQAQTEGRRPNASVIVSAVLTGFGSAARSTVAAAITIGAARLTCHDSRLRLRSGEPRANVEGLATLLEDTTPTSYGRLLLLSNLLQTASCLETAAMAPRLLRLCWASNAYHIRLDSLSMIRSFAWAVGDHPVRDEIVEALDEIHTDNWGLSTMLVESLDAYGLIEAPYDDEVVRGEIAQVLGNPSAQESRELAYTVVGNLFEDVVAEPYRTAVDALTPSDRTMLYTLALLGSPSYGFWNDWLLRQLLDSGDRRALPAFKRWATQLHKDNSAGQETSACYTLAVQGWAQFMSSPPSLVDCPSDDYRAWECYGAIIHWMCHTGLSDQEVARRAVPYWMRLQGELRLAAADPLYRLLDARRLYFDEDTPVIERLMQTFPEEVRSILEWSLDHRDSLTSVFSPHLFKDRASMIIEMLGSVGNGETVEMLRAYVDDPGLGRSAINAIKKLLGESA